MPDAPPPTYNSRHIIVPDWLLVVRYDSARDVHTVSWTQDGTSSQAHRQGAEGYPWDALQDLTTAVVNRIGDLSQARLF